MQQLGYQWAYIFTAIRPATGEDVTLVLPMVNAEAMQVFLDHVAASRQPDAHIVMALDGAGWRLTRALVAPEAITLVVLPPCSPELNPVERVWLYLRERFVSGRGPIARFGDISAPFAVLALPATDRGGAPLAPRSSRSGETE